MYIAIASMAGALSTAHAVVLFQLETFDSPTNWTSGAQNPSPPVITFNTGPTGTGDSSLQITSSPGSGPGSRLIAYNEVDWAGDYLGAGIHALTMDLRNQSSISSYIRVAVNGPGGWFVTPAQELGRFSTWTSASFDLTPGSLIDVGGSDAAATLGNVTEIRILHSTTDSFRGETGLRTLRVDNIQAVPEPSVGLLALGAALFSFRRRKD
ncbi:hypothetical protein HAHE_19020 [Haloferula helveola]|uniref:Ice-binding protein C-terminal domain-containing protein n=2 Tax=Haloferula helveola TaxID=490095 RepID=A0ABM7RE96_9BACT|nr:hypothetical protein HAHE_19020 [Haloferula helveola]